MRILQILIVLLIDTMCFISFQQLYDNNMVRILLCLGCLYLCTLATLSEERNCCQNSRQGAWAQRMRGNVSLPLL